MVNTKNWWKPRYSLRGFLLLIAIFAVWLSIAANRARQQRNAVAAILELGGSVAYKHEFDATGRRLPDTHPPGPRWLRRIIGDEYFTEVARVKLGESKSGGRITDDDLRHLASFRNLRYVAIGGSPIKGRGLKHLSRQTRLETVGLYNTDVDDEALRHLAGLKQVKWLNLEGTSVSDLGLVHLSAMDQIEFLNVGGTRVTGKGIANLSRNLKPTMLYLADTRVNDEAIVRLSKMTTLQELSIRNTNITASGYLRLKRALPSCAIWFNEADFSDNRSLTPEQLSFLLTRLQSLASEGRLKYVKLVSSSIEDRHVDDLGLLTAVQLIDLYDTRLSARGRARLRELLPEVEIRFDEDELNERESPPDIPARIDTSPST